MGPDPAGGFKLLKTIVYALVPSLAPGLAEGAGREDGRPVGEVLHHLEGDGSAAMPLEVVIEEV